MVAEFPLQQMLGAKRSRLRLPARVTVSQARFFAHPLLEGVSQRQESEL